MSSAIHNALPRIPARNVYNRFGVTYCKIAIIGTRIMAERSIVGVIPKNLGCIQTCSPIWGADKAALAQRADDAVFAPIETLEWRRWNRDIGNRDMAADGAPTGQIDAGAGPFGDTSGQRLQGEDQELTSNPASCGSPAFASAAAGRPMPVYEKPFR